MPPNFWLEELEEGSCQQLKRGEDMFTLRHVKFLRYPSIAHQNEESHKQSDIQG